MTVTGSTAVVLDSYAGQVTLFNTRTRHVYAPVTVGDYPSWWPYPADSGLAPPRQRNRPARLKPPEPRMLSAFVASRTPGRIAQW
jgi:hypothetical protein